MRAAEPGWYDDGSGRQRWWDGTRWTGQVADLSGPTVELRDETASSPAARPGWYDDGRGRLRWWNGSEWTAKTKFPGAHRSFAGISVSGEWIHHGPSSQPVGGVVARYKSAGEITIDGIETTWHVPVSPAEEDRAREFVAWVNGVSRRFSVPR